MRAAAKGSERIVETFLYLTSNKKRQVNQIKSMKENTRLREMANLMKATGRAQKDKTHAPPGPGQEKSDPNKRLKTGNTNPKIGDVK